MGCGLVVLWIGHKQRDKQKKNLDSRKRAGKKHTWFIAYMGTGATWAQTNMQAATVEQQLKKKEMQRIVPLEREKMRTRKERERELLNVEVKSTK